MSDVTRCPNGDDQGELLSDPCYDCYVWGVLEGSIPLDSVIDGFDDSPLLVGEDWFTDDASDNAARAEEMAFDATYGRMEACLRGGDEAFRNAAKQASRLANFLIWVAGDTDAP